MDSEKQDRIPIHTAFFMLAVAIFFDTAEVGLLVALVLPVVGIILNAISDALLSIGAGFTFWLWFKLHGVSIIDSVKRLVVSAGGFITELTPLGILPVWTVSTVLMVGIVRWEDRAENRRRQAAEAAAQALHPSQDYEPYEPTQSSALALSPDTSSKMSGLRQPLLTSTSAFSGIAPTFAARQSRAPRLAGALVAGSVAATSPSPQPIHDIVRPAATAQLAPAAHQSDQLRGGSGTDLLPASSTHTTAPGGAAYDPVPPEATHDEGVSNLNQAAREHPAELFYSYTEKDGTPRWKQFDHFDKGQISGDTNLKEVIEDAEGADRARIVHTHPEGLLGGVGSVAPPSLLDTMAGVYDLDRMKGTNTPGFEWGAVDSGGEWDISVLPQAKRALSPSYQLGQEFAKMPQVQEYVAEQQQNEAFAKLSPEEKVAKVFHQALMGGIGEDAQRKAQDIQTIERGPSSNVFRRIAALESEIAQLPDGPTQDAKINQLLQEYRRAGVHITRKNADGSFITSQGVTVRDGRK